MVVQIQDDAFHWGDAAIGAAATLGLTLAAGGALVLTRTGTSHHEKNDHA